MMSTDKKTHNPSIGSYLVGFILAVLFTLGSFIPVMYGLLDSWAISTKVIYLIGMALIQIIVQIVFFLHLNSGPDAKWNIVTLLFTAMCVFVIIGGTWWAISHLNYNMMGGSGRIIEPKINTTIPEDIPEEEFIGVPDSMEQSSETSEPVEQSSETSEPVEQSSETSKSVEQSSETSEPVEQSSETSEPVEQSSERLSIDSLPDRSYLKD
ncbi:Cytochrome o ubiquinol oxidase subunit IV [Bartonella clarridgeiae 73]|uniref:Cytochrome bo(3) ubiquinol oxidase subunit 4 n=2 Tax=Bartonella clarridgeiae TaxID=56426 RepID=E6YG31_BARC7|nr:Cytochrome o ubiquinol oxidase subunit IV [Bartonella clarridgeiae 73]